MISALVVLVLAGFFIAIAVKISKSVSEEKQVYALMKLKGTALQVSKANIPEFNRLGNIAIPLLDTYVNGPDQSMRARHTATPFHYVTTQNGFLADVWVQKDYVRTENELFVVEVLNGALVHVVRAEDYIKNSGSFGGLQNHVFTNTNPV